jgi:heat shock protein HspQ
MSRAQPKFARGELVRHRLFNYRGVIVDVHLTFQGERDWYERVARTRPPKDQPWYEVLPHGSLHQTYVAERNLDADASGRPIRHPLLSVFFSEFDGRHYRVGGLVN